ncbi:hypothetical protein [Streptosporangium sp. NPDC006930]|uniref:hypothetical protein n=1 Tax=Streptosporangium sp. NPDC006930 TaxID=3154783 RepID=UPI0034269CDB
MTTSTTTPVGGVPVAGGGLPYPAPLPRSATITVTQRFGARVTVSTWNTCGGVADFITNVLGTPGARVETQEQP